MLLETKCTEVKAQMDIKEFFCSGCAYSQVYYLQLYVFIFIQLVSVAGTYPLGPLCHVYLGVQCPFVLQSFTNLSSGPHLFQTEKFISRDFEALFCTRMFLRG